MMMLMQQQAAGGGFSPPPNVTAPTGMEGMGGAGMGQPGQQQFGYGGNYGEEQINVPACSLFSTLVCISALYLGRTLNTQYVMISDDLLILDSYVQ